MLRTRYLLSIIGLFWWTSAIAVDTGRPEVRNFINDVAAEHGFERRDLEVILKSAKSQKSILEAISRPAERVKPWHEYRAIFITDKRIAAGVDFWQQHEAELNRISCETGVPVEMLVGIIGVETYFGRITGTYRVLDALATLAFDYPPRAKFFGRELKEFLLLVREEDIDINDAIGSYAGAMGAPQFIPSSYRAYAVDADKTGGRDLWNSWTDIIGSVANYFVVHGWKKGQPVAAKATLGKSYRGKVSKDNKLKISSTVGKLRNAGADFAGGAPAETGATLIRLDGANGNKYWVGFDNFYVITRYNRSVMYALAVTQLGEAIASERRTDDE